MTKSIYGQEKMKSNNGVPAPGLKGVAGSFIEVAFHGDAVGRISVEVHNGVIVGDVLEMVPSL